MKQRWFQGRWCSPWSQRLACPPANESQGLSGVATMPKWTRRWSSIASCSSATSQTMCLQYISLAKMVCRFGSRIRTLIHQTSNFESPPSTPSLIFGMAAAAAPPMPVRPPHPVPDPLRAQVGLHEQMLLEPGHWGEAEEMKLEGAPLPTWKMCSWLRNGYADGGGSSEAKWELSKPEQINDEKGVRLLGADLSDGAWMMCQQSYTADLLAKKESEEMPKAYKRVPISREEDPDEVEENALPDVRMAQKCAGELAWLVARTRPDLMFAVGKMASGISRFPKEVKKMAVQTWSCFKGTLGLGLGFKKAEDSSDEEVLQATQMPRLAWSPGDVFWWNRVKRKAKEEVHTHQTWGGHCRW